MTNTKQNETRNETPNTKGNEKMKKNEEILVSPVELESIVKDIEALRKKIDRINGQEYDVGNFGTSNLISEAYYNIGLGTTTIRELLNEQKELLKGR